MDPHWSLWTPPERFLRAEGSTLGRWQSSQAGRVSTETQGPASPPGAPTSPQGLSPTPDTGSFLQGKAVASHEGVPSPPPPHTLLPSHPAARGLPLGGVLFPWGQSTHKLVTGQRVRSSQQGCRTEAGVACPGSGWGGASSWGEARAGPRPWLCCRPAGPSSLLATSAMGSRGHLSGDSEVGNLGCYHDLSLSLLGSPVVGVSPDCPEQLRPLRVDSHRVSQTCSQRSR